MLLNHGTYHSPEANRNYMSNSLYKKFMDCEAMAVAYLVGEWVEEPSKEMLVGSYVHSWNDGTRREFIANCPDMFTQKGTLKAEFQVADKMIETLANDKFCMYMLQGRKEVILTAEFAGAEWKIMIDVHNLERKRNIDLKTTRSIEEKVWNDELRTKVSFIEAYNYPLQAALYSEIERRASGRPEKEWLDFYIVAVSKEKVPDKAVINMTDHNRWAIELAEVEMNMPRILKVKAGEVEPVRCQKCDYCRGTKVLKDAIYYADLGA